MWCIFNTIIKIGFDVITTHTHTYTHTHTHIHTIIDREVFLQGMSVSVFFDFPQSCLLPWERISFQMMQKHIDYDYVCVHARVCVCVGVFLCPGTQSDDTRP